MLLSSYYLRGKSNLFPGYFVALGTRFIIEAIIASVSSDVLAYLVQNKIERGTVAEKEN
jgi:hypothetical protein